MGIIPIEKYIVHKLKVMVVSPLNCAIPKTMMHPMNTQGRNTMPPSLGIAFL